MNKLTKEIIVRIIWYMSGFICGIIGSIAVGIVSTIGWRC